MIFILVLGLAASANATFSLSFNSGTNVVSVNAVSQGDLIVGLVVDTGTLTSFALGPQGPGSAFASGPFGPGVASAFPDPLLNAFSGEVWTLATDIAEVAIDGSWLTAIVGAPAPGNFARLYEVAPGSAMTVGPALAIVEVIPEPMTIALLGLGSLFIRRKK